MTILLGTCLLSKPVLASCLFSSFDFLRHGSSGSDANRKNGLNSRQKIEAEMFIGVLVVEKLTADAEQSSIGTW